jgi:hypothetical protein
MKGKKRPASQLNDIVDEATEEHTTTEGGATNANMRESLASVNEALT